MHCAGLEPAAKHTRRFAKTVGIAHQIGFWDHQAKGGSMCHRLQHDLKAWQTQPVQEYFVWISVWEMEKACNPSNEDPACHAALTLSGYFWFRNLMTASVLRA